MNRLKYLWTGFGIGLSIALQQPLHAQIIPDSTLPSNSQTSPGCTQCEITGGTQRGVHLFHSFQQFSVPTGGSAWFNNSPQIQTIFSRVTGNAQSLIDGLIKTNGSTSLFFLNPNGIVFGPNAQLQIGGSFWASTANRVQFADGSEFSATNPQAPPLLTVHLTPGLQANDSLPQATLINRGRLVVGQDLTLQAGQLDIQGSLQAGRHLTLQAQHTVQVRDGATPFRAESGGHLTVQGHQGIDILALNAAPSAQVAFESGGDLRLISDGLISGDSHFASGGQFRLQSLSGQLADFTSLYDPIISSRGAVDMATTYRGASLLIESQGSVRVQGAVTITTPDRVSSFVGDDAILSRQPGLIIRSGQSNLVYSGTSTNPPPFTTGTVPAGITLDRPVRVQPTAAGATVRLTADNGGITFHSIDASSRTGQRGGAIALTAQGDIRNTGAITDTFGDPAALASFSISTRGDSAAAGAIALTSREGDIVLRDGGPRAYSYSYADGFGAQNGGNAGNGGAISFTAPNGNIHLTNAHSSSYSYSFSGSVANGGTISYSTDVGNITLIDSYARALAFSHSSSRFPTRGDAGTGGAISLATRIGHITLVDSPLSTYSSSLVFSDFAPNKQGNAADGGAISVSAQTGDIRLTRSAFSASSLATSRNGGNAGNGGAIAISTQWGDIVLTDSDLASNSSSWYNNAGQAGPIRLSSQTGNITLANSDLGSNSIASTGRAGSGGQISLSAAAGAIAGTNANVNTVAVSERGQASGQGGAVTLTAQESVSGLEIATLASAGESGTVQIVGTGNLQVNQMKVLTAQQVQICLNPPCSPTNRPFTVNLTNTGQAGDVRVSSSGDLSLNQTLIQSDTRGENVAGSVSITSPGTIRFNQSHVLSNTVGSGSAGDIAVQAGRRIDIANGSRLAAETTSAGLAGNLNLRAPQLALQQGAQLSTTATATATSRGGGRITLAVSDLELAGTVGVFAETQGQSPAGTLTLTPYGTDTTLNVALTPQAKISASTAGPGTGGNLVLMAPVAIHLSGPGLLAVETSGTGNAGNLTIATQRLYLSDRIHLSASTAGAGAAGDIQIITHDLIMTDGSRLSTNTSSTGRAGNIALGVKDRMELVGHGTGLFASTTANSTGNGGNITMDPNLAPRTVRLAEGAAIAVNSQGSGSGGNLGLQGGRLDLDQATISAETASTQGGNITLAMQDLVVLRRNSRISATAGTAQAGGDGGNITITAPFVVSRLDENSDITANAFTGNGGSITITTNAIFGLQFQPQLTTLSDITASSQFGLSGSVTLNLLNLDPSRGLVALPVNLVDPARQMTQACQPGSQQASGSFVVLGQGGLPSNPMQPLTQDGAIVRLATLEGTGFSSGSSVERRRQATQQFSGLPSGPSGEVVGHHPWSMLLPCTDPRLDKVEQVGQ
jgi:filamentous hemagglutinin family protein